MVGDLCVVNCYLPPTNSRWAHNASISPVDRLAQIMAACCARSSVHVILGGDLNARTNAHQCEQSCLLRSSPDTAPISGHGRVILQLAADNNLHILNGTSWQTRESLDLFTSFQPNGRAVVDYFLMSDAVLRSGKVISMTVTPHLPSWSDHALLCVHITLTQAVTSSQPRGGATESQVRVAMGNSPLDILLQNTLNKCQSQQQATAALYGPVRGVSAGATKVHTDGSCLKPRHARCESRCRSVLGSWGQEEWCF